MQRMFRYIFISIISLFVALPAVGQTYNSDPEDDDEGKPVVPKVLVLKDQGLSLGVDLSPVIMRIFNEEITGLAFVGRYGFNYKWWANAEVGYDNIQFENDNFEYTSNGVFIRAGVDYDIWQSEDFPNNDNLFIGVRYGYSWQSHKSDRFTIVDDYWGSYSGSVESSGVSTHMLDFLFGIRCEVLKNLYLGASLRGRFAVYSSYDDNLKPYAIAGYGTYNQKAKLSFTYTIEYQLPFIKFGHGK